MKRAIALLGVLAAFPAFAGAASRLLALAVDDRMTVLVGKYDVRKGWVQSTAFYEPPQPGDPFTLYGPQGMVAQVHVTDDQRANPDGVFATWTANLSSWNNRTTPTALAVSGADPLPTDSLPAVSANLSECQAVVSRYLRKRGLSVEAPHVTEILELTGKAPGQKERILVARSDPKEEAPPSSQALYSVALLWWQDGSVEQVKPLASQTSHRIAGRTSDEQTGWHGSLDVLHLLAAEDIDGDGWREIVLTYKKDAAVQVDVFTFDGRKLKKVLSAYKADYN